MDVGKMKKTSPPSLPKKKSATAKTVLVLKLLHYNNNKIEETLCASMHDPDIDQTNVLYEA